MTAAILDVGQFHRWRGDHKTAAAAYEAALAIYQADAHREREVARTLNQLALVREEAGDHASALALYERGLALGQRAFRKSDPELATILANLGGLERRQGRLGEAEAHLREAIAVERQTGRGRGAQRSGNP